MKNKAYLTIGKILVVLFAIAVFGTLLFNYGCAGRAFGIYFTDDYSFQFSNIGGTDWIVLFSVGLWLFLIIGPWMQYFTMRQKDYHSTCNITSQSGLFPILFTVVNIFLVVACVFLNVRFGDESDIQFGYDRLLLITVAISLIYIPWSIVVMVLNYRTLKSCQCDRKSCEQLNSSVWQWLLSSLVFVALGVMAFDGWYNWRYDFYQGRAIQWVDVKCGYINRFHQVVIPYIYDNCGDFSEGVAYVGIDSEEGTRYGCIDRNGNLVISCVYDWCSAPIYDLIYVKLNGIDACFTLDGKECIPMIYDHIGHFYPGNNDLALVISTDDRYGFIRRNGDVVIPISYDYCETFFTDGLVRAQIDEKWGYLNYKGEEVIPFVYDEAGIFMDKRAEVKIGAETYFIDTEGRRL